MRTNSQVFVIRVRLSLLFKQPKKFETCQHRISTIQMHFIHINM